jgi:RimJ/RimL family protein N-acetyltransferase
MEFVAIPWQERRRIEALAACDGRNPFLAPAWGDARRRHGRDVVGLAVEDGDRTLGGAFGILRAGTLRRTLEIESAPSFADPNAAARFWTGLESWCRSRRVTDLVVNTFAAPEGLRIPPLPGEVSRAFRWEFVLPLQGDDLRGRLRKSHRNRVNRGAREGLRVRRGSTEAERDAHLAAVFGSRRRRLRRGESVGGQTDPDYFHAFAETGAGEYFQAVTPDGEVLSSILVLRAPAGAYTHSSGTTPEGMERSAAHFLRYEMSRMLREDGLEILYMGGVSDPAGGLAEYKRGFGAEVRKLEKARSYLGSAARRKASTLVALVRDDPLEIPRTLAGRVERSFVFAADVATYDQPAELPAGWSFGQMELESVRALEERDDELAPYARRFRGREFSDAWEIRIEGDLAHVSWMIPHENDVRLPVRNLKLRPGEAEITHAITPVRFRGRGLFPLAIRLLMQVARDRRYETVFALTGETNVPSQRAILKAGFVRHGDVVRWILPYLPGSPYVTWRGHRLRGRPKS